MNVAGRQQQAPAAQSRVMMGALTNDPWPQRAFEDQQDLRVRCAPAATPRVLLVDDEREFLRAVALQLKDEFEIVGMSLDGARAVALTTKLSPDVVVLDISMPTTSGLDAALCLGERHCPSRVVFLTVHDDPDFVQAALNAGAAAYVLKPRLVTDLVPAIWAALNGDIFISPPLRPA